MTCEECREMMLEADMEQLSGAAASSFAEHMQGCARCHAMASRILESQRSMVSAFAEAAPSMSVQEMVGIARGEGRPDVLDIRSGMRRKVPGRMWALISVAAAAAVVLTVVNRPWKRAESVLPVVGSEVSPDAQSNLEVEVPEGRNAIIMNTRDPKISVVWIY